MDTSLLIPCSRCQISQCPDDFPNDPRASGGKGKQCKTCRKRFATDPETHRIRERERRAADPEKIRRQDRIRHAANADVINEERRAKRAANPEPFRLQARAHYAKDPEKNQKEAKARRAADPEKFRRQDAERYKADPQKKREHCRASNNKRRALKANAPINDFSEAQWHEVVAAFRSCCAYCRRRMKHLTQDHITPLEKGGSHTLRNIVPACRSCNSKKGVGPPLCPVQPLLFTIAKPKKDTGALARVHAIAA